MIKEKVNTDGITSAAAKLRNANGRIDTNLGALKNKASELENSWNSAAGNKACSVMYQLFKIGETRSSIIQNYVNMLEQ